MQKKVEQQIGEIEIYEMQQKQTEIAHKRAMDAKNIYYFDLFNKFHLHTSCLGCDIIKLDSMSMICGHNICRTCINKYSRTDHPRSSIRCEVCAIETKIIMLTVSIPHQAICSILLEA